MKNTLTFLFLFLVVGITYAQIANQPADLYACDDDGDGIAAFDLTITEPEILGAQDPLEFSITFYISQSDATNASNPIVSPALFYNSVNPQAIYVRLEAVSNGSFDTSSFALLVLEAPIINAPSPLELCDDETFGNTTDGYSTFDLTVRIDEITGGDPNLSVYFYETEVDQSNDVSISPPHLLM